MADMNETRSVGSPVAMSSVGGLARGNELIRPKMPFDLGTGRWE